MTSKTATAILVDGGFYRKRAKSLFGMKSPQAASPRPPPGAGGGMGGLGRATYDVRLTHSDIRQS